MLQETSFRLTAPITPGFQLNNSGVQLLNNGNIPQAIEKFTQAIQLEPSLVSCYCNRGSAFLQLGKIEQAIDDYNMAIKLKPDYAEAYGNRGMLYHEMGQDEQALRDFTMAVELVTDDHVNFYNRGGVWKNMGEYEKAVKDYTRAIELVPDFSQAFIMRGATYLEMDLFESAISDCDKTLQLDPTEISAYMIRGQAFFNSQQFLKSLSDFELLLQSSPENITALTHLSALYKKTNQYDLAYEFLLRIAELDGITAENLYERASCLELMKNWTLAIKHYSALIDCIPEFVQDHPDVIFNRGRCHFTLGDFSSADKDFTHVISLQLTPWSQHALEMKHQCQQHSNTPITPTEKN